MKSTLKRFSVASFLLSSVVLAGLVLAAENPGTPSAAAPSASSGKIEVVRAVLTSSLQDHEPAAEITSAKVGDVVVGWNQIRSDAEGVKIHHKWLHEGTLVSDVTLDIKASPYRTWSRKTLSEPGAWTWQITTDTGEVLKEVPFTVSQ